MIPHVVHQIWVGDEPPDHLQALMSGWENMPGWKYKLWRDEDIDLFGLTNINLYRNAENLVGSAEVGQLKSDIARLEILFRYGGVYVDADMELKKPFDELAKSHCFLGMEDHYWVNNAIFGAEEGHQFVAELIAKLPANVMAQHAEGVRRPNRMSGPQFVTPIYRDGWQERVTIYPPHYFYPYSWAELERGESGEIFPDSYSVHHWHHRRMTRGTPDRRDRFERALAGRQDPPRSDS